MALPTHGRRRAYLAGVLISTTASLACALAPDIQALIAFRLVQGAGAAVLVPQVFSIIQLTFTGPARARALSAYAAVLSAGAAGPPRRAVLVSAPPGRAAVLPPPWSSPRLLPTDV